MTRATKRRTRTSLTDPLLVPTIPIGRRGGRLGITLCPGKIDALSPTGQCWQRDLAADIAVLTSMQVHTVISLVEPWELEHLGVGNLGIRLHQEGIEWYHLPIVDMSIPTQGWDNEWDMICEDVRDIIADGETVVVHCRGGVGRAGTVACRVLIEAGWEARDALVEVRRVRPGAVETRQQENYVMALTPPDYPERHWTDYPIERLGDAPNQTAPIREVELLSYDQDKYVRVKIGPLEESIKAGYVYTKPGRCQKVPAIKLATLRALPETEI